MLNDSKTRTDGAFDHYGYYSNLNLARFGEDASVVPAASATPTAAVTVSTVADFRAARQAGGALKLIINSAEELAAFQAAYPGKFDDAVVGMTYNIGAP